jgi:hypothetical protein
MDHGRGCHRSGATVLAVTLYVLAGCSYPYQDYENESSYNGDFICPKGKLTQLFRTIERVPRDGDFAFVENATNLGNSRTFEESANVAVIVVGEHVALAVLNHRSLNDSQHTPADILPLLRSYEEALLGFGCRKGEVTLGTERSEL